ncbi:glycosyltransferase family 2 protein [Maridesulfovibrio sp. FT414]|uniref:glycosyltransferase family 2 protein n=1 Tax=Maridesulfovibrio sp. FT414 TaxID=2979469 RepID=UPI003D801E1D
MISNVTECIVGKTERFLNMLKNTVPLWVLGTEEPAHQRGLINVFRHLSNEHPDLLEVSRKLALLMWTQNPLDRSAAARCLELDSDPGPRKQLLEAILSAPQENIPSEDLDTLLRSADSKLIIRHLFPFLRGPQGIAWLAETWNTLLRLGSPELPLSALDLVTWPDSLLQLKQRLTVEYNFLYHSPAQTITALQGLDEKIWTPWKGYIYSEQLLRAGAKEEAISVLSALWRDNIWNINWGQKLYLLTHPISTAGALSDSAEVAILLYSWNNGKLIEKTLKNVAGSRIGEARVFALNNGSSDNTPEVVAEAGTLFAQGRYKGIQLPINVGAPPARNWLLSEPEVRKAKWAVFLDDDVELPENWLEELLATAKHYGNPGAVGCRITSASTPQSLQSADYHLFNPATGSSQIEGLTERVMVFDSCRNAFDCGQFSYTRPAVHLSGCCHMLNMEAVHKCGGFDVRFNPTQFDDLERDLRAYLAGYDHIYAGQLGVKHIQHSSLAKASNIRSMAQVFGNKIKLESKYTENDLNAIFARDLGTLWADTVKKWMELSG